MADTLYGQVVANYLGLGGRGARTRESSWLVPKPMVASHLRVEAEFNPSPYGLTVVTTTGSPPRSPKRPNRPEPEPNRSAPADRAAPAAVAELAVPSCGAAMAQAKYDSVWMGGAPDWASLQISLGPDGVGLEAAMAMAQKELDHYRVTLRDQWNIHGLTANDGYGVDGQPWCTAHYGFHVQ